MEDYTPDMAGSGQRGICGKCKLPPTPEGHDGCLGTLQGDVMNACCGHGNDNQAYIQYWDRSDVRGADAILEQARLISDRQAPRLVSAKTFRSIPSVNMTDDMVRVTIDMTRKHWRTYKDEILFS